METSTTDRTALDRARRSRDPRFDGRFFVGVTTTVCSSRCWPSGMSKVKGVLYSSSVSLAG